MGNDPTHLNNQASHQADTQTICRTVDLKLRPRYDRSIIKREGQKEFSCYSLVFWTELRETPEVLG